MRYTLADFLASSHLDLAIRLAPSNPNLLLRRGSTPDLERAVQLAPASSAPLIALALAREQAGQPAEAERLLLEALERDATFTPKWSLANFYFRQQRLDGFWRWASASTRNYQGDLSALFRLGLLAGPDPRNVYSRLVPDNRAARRQFAETAFTQGHISDTVFAALALAGDHDPRDRDLLLSYCDSLLEQGDGDGAVRISQASGGVDPPGRCFGWRTEPGLTSASAEPGKLAIVIGGMQADPAVVARRWIAATPGRLGRLHYRAQLELRAGSGHLRWRVAGETSAPLAGEGQMLFRPPAGKAVSMLELVSIREIGLAKPEGRVVIEDVTVRPQ